MTAPALAVPPDRTTAPVSSDSIPSSGDVSDVDPDEVPELKLDAFAAGVPMSPEEFDAVQWEECDQDYRYELLGGRVIMSPIPRRVHERAVDRTGYLLNKYREEHPDGGAIDETLPGRYVHLPNGDRRRADRAVWCGLGREVDEDADVPAIAIEVVSRSRRDRIRDVLTKRDEYRAAGVREYWILDPADRSLRVVTPEAEHTFGEDDTYTTPLLPGFEMPVRDAFALTHRPRPAGDEGAAGGG